MKEGDDGSAGSLRTDICRDAAGDRGGDRGRTWGDFTLVPDPAVPIHRPTTATYLGKGKVTFLAGGTEARRHFSNDCGKTWEYLVTPHPSKGWTAAGEGNQLVDWDANGMAARIAEFGSNRWLVEKGPDLWRTRDVDGKIAWSTDGGRTWKDEVTRLGPRDLQSVVDVPSWS